jgi:tail collar domain
MRRVIPDIATITQRCYNGASRNGNNEHRSIFIMRSMVFTCACATVAGLFGGSGPAKAQEPPFLSEVIFLAANFCPNGTLAANGALLQIEQNQALFSLLGTRYGGDGTKTFGLPKVELATGTAGAPLTVCIRAAGMFPRR